jgi:CRP/FNR family transcriptional regulator
MSITTLERPDLSVRIIAIDGGRPDPAPQPYRLNCSTCHLRDLCLPGGMTGGDIERLDALLISRRRVKAGQVVYREGDRFEFMYAIRSGTFKTSLMLADGREQVSGFYMAGELMGLDALAAGAHASTATSLEDAEVCSIPYLHLSEVAVASTGMQHLVARLMSREIVREQILLLLLGGMNAEERLSAFLLDQSRRLNARGYSPSEFHLRMSRAEIGSYLGVTLETVSRTFSAFHKQRLIEVNQRHVRIIDMAGLAGATASRMH